MSHPYSTSLLSWDVLRHSYTKARREMQSGILASLTPWLTLVRFLSAASRLSLQLSHGENCISVVLHLLCSWNRMAATFLVVNIRKKALGRHTVEAFFHDFGPNHPKATAY